MVIDRVIRNPPDKPDSRMVFIGGCGFITIVRGINILWGNQPQADLFYLLGNFFIYFWGVMWMATGLFVTGVALTGHRYPKLDLTAAYLLLCVWWLWSLIYLLSAIFVHNERLPDFLASLILLITGLVLTAGIIMSIRKTQLLVLNEALRAKVDALTSDLSLLADKSKELREELGEDDS